MNAPKLRFKEFKDDYIKLRYKDVLKIKSGKDQKQVEDKNGKYPILGTGGQIGKTNSFLYDKPSVLIGRKGTINKPQYMESPFWTVDTLFYSHIYEPNIPKYLFYSFQNVNWKKYDESTGVPSLSSSTIESVECSIPSPNEQIKVANFLSLLDKKIELQTKKIEDLKLFKLYMENQFIFKDDASYIEYKLRDILIEGNKTPVADTSKYQKLTIKLNLKGLEFNESQKEMSDKRPFYVRDENELIIGKQNYFNGSIAIVNKKYAGGICSNAIMSFKAKDGFDIKYIYLYLSQKSYMKQREFLANGTGQKELSEKEFLNFSIRIPSDNKVKKIIKNVNCISKKILLEENKLNKLIELKRGLMQDMFV